MMYIFATAAVGAGAGLLSISPFLILLEIIVRKQIPLLPLRHTIGSGVFCLTLSAILSVTGIPAVYSMRFNANINLTPLTCFPSNASQYVENALLFIPIGVLLPLLYQRFQKLLPCALYGFFLSLAIELMQLFCFRATDIDDLLMNTLGAVVGFGIFVLFKKLYPPVAADFCLSDGETEKLPALFRLEAFILTAAAWGAALFFAPVIREIIWAIFL